MKSFPIFCVTFWTHRSYPNGGSYINDCSGNSKCVHVKARSKSEASCKAQRIAEKAGEPCFRLRDIQPSALNSNRTARP